MSSSYLSILLIVLAVDLIFTMARSSLVNARLPLLADLRDQHPRPVDKLIQLLEKPRLRTTLRMGMSIVHFLLGGLALGWFLSAVSISIQLAEVGVIIGGAIILVTLEALLEGIVLRSPEQWAIRLLFFGQLFDLILRPIAWLLILLQGQPQTTQNPLGSITEDDFRNWVEDGQPSGSLEKGERKMIYSIIQFRETLCREVMVPRIDVLALDVNTPLSEAILALTHSGHSRVPVYEETIDNIVGVLYAKDLLRVKTPEVSPSTLRGLFRPAYFVPEAKKVDELLTEMQARGVHIAIVVDEYGGMAGLVTLEDIVEEIVGEIRDEYDQTEELPFQKIGDEEYLFSGRISLDDFNELLDTHLATDIADTLGGFIYGEIGRVPVGGEQVEVEGWTLVVDQVSGRRIRKVKAMRKPGLVEVEEKKNDSEH